MATALQYPEVGSGSGFVSEETRHQVQLAHAVCERQKQALHLQRGNILSQNTTNPARRAALVAALAQIDGEIQAIN